MTPAEIAAKLTPAQRRHVAGLHRSPAWRTTVALCKAGLMETRNGFVDLTPLGLAVRALLKDQKNEQ